MGVVTDRFNRLVAVEYTFTTMNNVDNAANLDINKGECALLQNVDVSDGYVYRRDGYVAAAVTSSTHSGWSNGQIALCVDNGYLSRFDGSTTKHLLYIGDNTCAFTSVNEIIVFTNTTYTGFVEDGNAELLQNTPVGQCIEFYNGRLYIASSETLYCAEAFTLDTDVDYGVVAVFDSKITMLRRVQGGLFVGTEKEIFFLRGAGPQSGFSQQQIADYGSIYGTDVFTNGENVKDGGSGEAVLWCSKRGVCFGGADGAFRNITETYYTYEFGSKGCGILRFKDGQTHYIANVAQENPAFNQNTPQQLDVDSIVY